MFKNEYMTLRQLGSVFGASSHDVGKWLVDIGLRTKDKKPSSRAYEERFVKTTNSRGEGYIYVWHSHKTSDLLLEAGHRLNLDIPENLAPLPSLCGCFTKRQTEGNLHQLLNEKGRPVAVVVGEENATFLLKLLNSAHRAGMIDKHFPESVAT